MCRRGILDERCTPDSVTNKSARRIDLSYDTSTRHFSSCVRTCFSRGESGFLEVLE